MAAPQPRALGVTFVGPRTACTRSPSVCFAAMDPTGFAAATSLASYLFGGIGYAFIIGMAATSFDRPRRDRPRAWRLLHLCGGYYLWLQFMSRSAADSRHAAVQPVPIPLLVVLALRLIAWRSAQDVQCKRDSLAAASAFDQQMELPAKLTVNGKHRRVDIADSGFRP